MRILIRIIFVFFIANGIDCLGSDICCIPPKYENIIKRENNIAESLVNTDWYNAKNKNLVLKIFEKEGNGNVFISKDNKYKISIEFDKRGKYGIFVL